MKKLAKQVVAFLLVVAFVLPSGIGVSASTFDYDANVATADTVLDLSKNQTVTFTIPADKGVFCIQAYCKARGVSTYEYKVDGLSNNVSFFEMQRKMTVTDSDFVNTSKKSNEGTTTYCFNSETTRYYYFFKDSAESKKSATITFTTSFMEETPVEDLVEGETLEAVGADSKRYHKFVLDEPSIVKIKSVYYGGKEGSTNVYKTSDGEDQIVSNDGIWYLPKGTYYAQGFIKSYSLTLTTEKLSYSKNTSKSKAITLKKNKSQTAVFKANKKTQSVWYKVKLSKKGSIKLSCDISHMDSAEVEIYDSKGKALSNIDLSEDGDVIKYSFTNKGIKETKKIKLNKGTYYVKFFTARKSDLCQCMTIKMK